MCSAGSGHSGLPSWLTDTGVDSRTGTALHDRGRTGAARDDPGRSSPYRLDNLTNQSTGREKGEGAASWFAVALDGREFRPTMQSRWKTNEERMTRLLAAGRVQASRATLSYVLSLDDFAAFCETTSETLELRASPTTPARDDVHEHDQGDDDHRRDGDDGDGGRGEDHASVFSLDSLAKP